MPTRERSSVEVDLRVADRHAIDLDLALLERLQRVHALDQRRLAGARGAADHHHLALLDAGRAVGQHLEGAVPPAHLVDFDHRVSSGWVRSCRSVLATTTVARRSSSSGTRSSARWPLASSSDSGPGAVHDGRDAGFAVEAGIGVERHADRRHGPCPSRRSPPGTSSRRTPWRPARARTGGPAGSAGSRRRSPATQQVSSITWRSSASTASGASSGTMRRSIRNVRVSATTLG